MEVVGLQLTLIKLLNNALQIFKIYYNNLSRLVVMDYSLFSKDIKVLLEAMDKAILEKDYLKINLFLSEYRKMIYKLNFSTYFNILISNISKVFNRDEVCVTLARNVKLINKELLKLNRFLLKHRFELANPNNITLLSLVQNYWMLDDLESELIKYNTSLDRTYYYAKNQDVIEDLFNKNEELKRSID